MRYIDGFVIPAEDAKKDEFRQHAETTDVFFITHGALSVVEGWADDVPDGKLTDFRKSVQAKDGESVVFSWIVWPDKATRDAAMKAMTDDAEMMAQPMPFDGKRMIFGGFEPIIEYAGKGGRVGYIDGFVTPVSPSRKDAYIALAKDGARMFEAAGALLGMETWGEDVPAGKVTDFHRAVKAEGDEVVVFSFIGWPDKATRDAAWKKMVEDMQPPAEMPMDGKRMFWGGFQPIVQLEA